MRKSQLADQLERKRVRKSRGGRPTCEKVTERSLERIRVRKSRERNTLASLDLLVEVQACGSLLEDDQKVISDLILKTVGFLTLGLRLETV